MVEVSIQIQKNELGYIAYSPDISEERIEGTSLDDVVSELKEILRQHLDTPKPIQQETTGQSLLNLFDSITSDIDEDEMATLPADGAEQHDHYIYGTPKQETSKQPS